MALMVWIAACLACAVAFRRHPVQLVIASLAVWTSIPAVASDSLTGHEPSSINYHAATWLVLSIFAVQLLTRPHPFVRVVLRRFPLYLVILLVIAAAGLETKTGSSSHGLVLVMDQMFAPFLLFWIIDAALTSDPRGAALLRNGVIGLAAAEAAFAVAQYATGSVILYGSFYTQRYWFSANYDRWMGTTDHPLVLAVLLCAAIPMLAGLKTTWTQQVLTVLMLVGVVLTQSRSGIVAAGVGAIYVVLASRASATRKLVAVVILAGGAIALATSSLSNGVADRIANDTGSTMARGKAIDYFLSHWQHYLTSGGGVNSSYTVATDAGLSTSFESAFLMYSIDIGILFATLYFGAQVAIVLLNGRAAIEGALLSALIVIVLCQSFSSLGVETLLGPLLWVIVALGSHAYPLRSGGALQVGKRGDSAVAGTLGEDAFNGAGAATVS